MSSTHPDPGGRIRLRACLRAFAVIASAAILLAACGSSSSSSSVAATTASARVPATTTSTAASATTTTTTAAATSAATANAPFNSCSVVTRAEAARALGGSVTTGILGSATVEGGLACVFYGPSAPKPTTPNVAQPDSVRVVVVKGPDALRYYNAYQSKVHAQPLSGYGDRAYYDGIGSLSVLTGDSYLRIAVIPGGAPPSLTDEEQLATAILPAL
ncbi:MAG TPA: hypothetical protein VMF57_03920 [Solirubrobacteraceae bacterium]|nr:hypothetical protein [Solirubrobacteraceae bacterium]